MVLLLPYNKLTSFLPESSLTHHPLIYPLVLGWLFFFFLPTSDHRTVQPQWGNIQIDSFPSYCLRWLRKVG